MKINLHNYEEFLIDYLHNELSEADRLAVEQFLNQNQDIREEYERLCKTVFIPEDECVYPKKQELYQMKRIAPRLHYKKSFAAAAIIAGLLAGALFLSREQHDKAYTTDSNKPLQTSQTFTPSNTTTTEQVATTIQPNQPKVVPTTVSPSAPARIKRMHKVASNVEQGPKTTETPLPHQVQQQEIAGMDKASETTPTMASLPPADSKSETPLQDIVAAQEPATVQAESIIAINKHKQPKLFKAIAGVVKFTRKVKHTRETISNSGLTVMLGKRKLLNIN